MDDEKNGNKDGNADEGQAEEEDFSRTLEDLFEALRRGEPGEDDGSIREMTRNLYAALILDTWPTPATVLDFGIASEDHYAALQYAVRDHGVTLKELDEALGKGPALTALIRPGNPYHGLVFKTDWDDIQPGLDCDEEICDGRPVPEPTPQGRPDEGPRPEQPEAQDLFGEVIFRYTRREALADGVLVDVSETAKEAGLKSPVALTAAAWAEYVAVPEGVEGQDEAGRLWDILWMCRYGISQGKNRDASEILFRLHVRNDNGEGEPPLVTLKAVCGPDDDASPCLTIMLPDED